MSTDGTTDQIKGRVKEAAGALVGDRKLRRKGKLDRVAGDVKEKLGRVVDRLKQAAGR
jgi:uncharacterized protein YjbJ (UPF0337 family)